MADEIVRRGVADVLDDGGIDVAQIDETAGQGLGMDDGNGHGNNECSDECFHENYPLRHGRASVPAIHVLIFRTASRDARVEARA